MFNDFFNRNDGVPGTRQPVTEERNDEKPLEHGHRRELHPYSRLPFFKDC